MSTFVHTNRGDYHHNDLRTHDHYALKLAQQRATEGWHPAEAGGGGDSAPQQPLPMVAIVCLDVRLFAQPSLVGGFYRQSPQRATFLLRTVEALRHSLATLGIPLIIRTGYPEEQVPKVLQELRCVAAFMTTQYAPHEEVPIAFSNTVDLCDGLWEEEEQETVCVRLIVFGRARWSTLMT